MEEINIQRERTSESDCGSADRSGRLMRPDLVNSCRRLIPRGLSLRRPLSMAVAALMVLALGSAPRVRGAQSAMGTVRGNITAIGPDTQPFNVAGAGVKLSKAAPGPVSVSVFSSEAGEYKFAELAAGSYSIETSFQGFKKFIKTITIHEGEALVENISLELEELQEVITVEATTGRIDVNDVAPPSELKQQTLQTVPLANERFQDALPLTPGVVRGPDGLLNVKGSRASQSGLVVNSANVTDPVTGEYAINLPIDSVQSLQVLTNPYATEYGKFAGGITSIETRQGGDKWKVQFQNFFPRLRKRDGSIVGIGATTPRLSFGGPLKKDKVKFFQSFEYRFVRTEVEVDTLPPLKRDTKLESFDSLTQIDWDLDASNHLTTTFSLFPQKLGFVGLNTFNPEEVTANFKQRGFFWAINDRKTFGNGSLLESYFSIKQFDANVFPSSGDDGMNFAPNVNSGNFFNHQDRDSRRYEALEVYNFAPRKFAGSHLIKIGAGFSYNTFDGRNQSNTVRVLRADGTRSQQIDFIGNTALERDKTELLTYFQDKWNVSERLTLEYGVRYDRDTISDENSFAPRFAFAFLPTRNGRTVVRAGAGLFYDKITLNVATFEQLQDRVLTPFAADGQQIIGAPRRQHLVLEKGRFQTPRSGNWNIELDREWIKNLFIRVGYQQREGRREYVLNPVEHSTLGSVILLSNGGSSRYREFQATARYKFHHSDQLVASYVRSRATGDLNDFNSFFGNFENPIIRPNERSRLPWDAPNRFLFWGDITLKYKITVSPVLDIHTGFPLSIIDEDRNFVGRRNRAGRFPTFASLDLQALKTISLPILGKKYKARVGLRVFNITNNFNPRDFQGNLASSNFGTFSNDVARKFRAKFVLEF